MRPGPWRNSRRSERRCWPPASQSTTAATHLAVGNDLESRLRLEFDGPIHGAVLDLLERRGRHASGHEFVPSAQELWRAQQASDDVCVGDDQGRLLKEGTFTLPVSKAWEDGKYQKSEDRMHPSTLSANTPNR